MRLIDADALAETLEITDMSCERCAWYDRTKSLCGRGGDFEDACAAIEDAPTVEERETGKWMPFEFGNDEWHKCSACGIADHYVQTVERKNGSIGRLTSVRNYCPNCGARMEE